MQLRGHTPRVSPQRFAMNQLAAWKREAQGQGSVSDRQRLNENRREPDENGAAAR